LGMMATAPSRRARRRMERRGMRLNDFMLPIEREETDVMFLRSLLEIQSGDVDLVL
jgi:hypothetical protein